MQPGQQQPPAYQQGPPQPQTVVVQQQPVVTVHQGANATGAGNQRGSWCWKGLQITGYMQTVLGILAVLFGIVHIIMRSYLSFIGTPIWTGICFFIVAGILGIAAGRKRASGVVVGYMVMSILSSLAAFGVLSQMAGTITYDSHICPDHYYSNGFYPYSYSSYRCSTSRSARVGVDVCILLIGLAEFIISIVGASFTCCGLYYNSPPRPMVTYQSNPQQIVVGAPPQGVFYPTGATVAYPNQVVLQPAQSYQPQGQFQPPPQGQFQQPPQGQFQPPPQGQFQPPPQQQVHPEAPLDPNKGEDHYQPLTK